MIKRIIKKYPMTICWAIGIGTITALFLPVAYDLRGGHFSMGGEWLPILSVTPALLIVEWLDS